MSKGGAADHSDNGSGGVKMRSHGSVGTSFCIHPWDGVAIRGKNSGRISGESVVGKGVSPIF